LLKEIRTTVSQNKSLSILNLIEEAMAMFQGPQSIRVRFHGSIRQYVFVLLVFYFYSVVEKKHQVLVSSLQIYGSISSSPGSQTLKACYSGIRSTTFLTSQALLREVVFSSESSPPNYGVHLLSTPTKSIISMAKGDGKKKRKRKEKPAALPPSAPVQPIAARVSNDINIPIRRQIRYGKLNKQHRQTGSTSFRQTTAKVVRTKYRRSWGESFHEDFHEAHFLRPALSIVGFQWSYNRQISTQLVCTSLYIF
jgi:hypothetical protein